MPPLVADFSSSMPQQLEGFLELSSISKWRKMRRVLGIPWRSPSYLHLVSIEGLQSFMKMSPLQARGRASFLVLGASIHGILEGGEEEEMKSFIHGFLKEEDDGSWHPLGEEKM